MQRSEDNIRTGFEINRLAGVDWNYMALDLDRWRAVVTKVMKFHVIYSAGEFLL